MQRRLTVDQIHAVCESLLRQTRHVTADQVVSRLREVYGASGRRERVCRILRGLKQAESVIPVDDDVESLRRKLVAAEARAARAEELERRHQDFWANRYAEKIEELQEAYRQPAKPAVTSEQYLRLYQRAAELRDRLTLYEDVGPLLPGDGGDESRKQPAGEGTGGD